MQPLFEEPLEDHLKRVEHYMRGLSKKFRVRRGEVATMVYEENKNAHELIREMQNFMRGYGKYKS